MNRCRLQARIPRCRQTIATHAHEHGEVLCPHITTAMHQLDRLRGEGDTVAWAVVATEHPAKFESVVERLTGWPLPMPPAFSTMLASPASAEPLAAKDTALGTWLASH